MSKNTRFLILSDTHANDWTPPDAPVDVAIHCGDLTEEAKLHEFHHALRMLRNIKADLKLVIAGNHDWTLDTPKYEKKVAEAKTNAISEDAITREWGTYGEARALIKEAAAAADEGIVFLDEGKHQFNLKNGAHLNLFASPYTASPHADGAFQYTPTAGHDFDIEADIDVVITHSPPKGVLDRTDNRTNAGCPQLFEAVARARPRLHCFGHIHEAWGAKLITWRAAQEQKPTALTAIDGGNSTVVESLTTLHPTKFDTEDSRAEKAKRLATYTNLNFCRTTQCPKAGEQTLFVNAAIEGPRDGVFQVPWVVDMELPVATEAATAAAAAASTTTPNTTTSTQSASATHSARPALPVIPPAPRHKRRRSTSDCYESATDVPRPRKRQRRLSQECHVKEDKLLLLFYSLL